MFFIFSIINQLKVHNNHITIFFSLSEMDLLIEELREVRLEMGSLSLALGKVSNLSTWSPSGLESTQRFDNRSLMMKPEAFGPFVSSFGDWATFWLTGVLVVALFSLMLRHKFRPLSVSKQDKQMFFFCSSSI
jgi:hypothetical protein